MHIIKPYETTITLFCRDGRVSQYPSIKAAGKALGVGWISRNVGEHFRAYTYTSALYTEERIVLANGESERLVVYEKHYNECNYVMRDDAGRPVGAWAFNFLYRSKRKFPRSFDQCEKGAPVPGSGSTRAGRHYYRRIRCLNAVRAATTFEEEGEVPTRVSRGEALLPDRWEGREVANRRDRSWKKFRKTQWR